MKTIALSPAIREILANAEKNGYLLRLASQLDRKTYTQVDQVIRALGGKWNQRKAAHVFDRPVEAVISEALADGGVVKNPLGFYATPDGVIKKMLDVAGVPPPPPFHTGNRINVLEPSAGDGAIVRALCNYAQHIETITAIEVDPVRASRLAESVEGSGVEMSIHVEDFLTIPSEELLAFGAFDRILMNPPFVSAECPHAYFLHVMRAWEMLAENGVLVAVCPVGFWNASKPRDLVVFKNFVNTYGSSVELPEDSFAESGTRVRTCLVVLGK
jgi:hypothetical protein